MDPRPEERRTCEEIIGTGSCPQAQADGVPCPELGRDCEICEAAMPPAEPRETPPEQDRTTRNAMEW